MAGISGSVILSSSFGIVILPVPPLQLLRVPLASARVVDGAAEDVEETAVLGLAAKRADRLVDRVRVLAAQVGDAPETHVEEVLRDRRADAGDRLEVAGEKPFSLFSCRRHYTPFLRL